MSIAWLEQRQSDVPADNDWLSAEEKNCLGRLRVPKRCDDWRLGRWTAKQAVASYLRRPHDPRHLAGIEIRASDSGAPEIFLQDQPTPLSISLSHSHGTALCTVSSSEMRLGCDVEAIEPRSDAFVSDYFTADEQHIIAQASRGERATFQALIWSAKESALKALREGLRLDTRSVRVSFGDALLPASSKGQQTPSQLSFNERIPPEAWRYLNVDSDSGGAVFAGWWRVENQMVRTIVCESGR